MLYTRALMAATLHYIYDPLCGWCYGAEPLVDAARDIDALELALHGGGLWPEPTSLPEDRRHYIKQADARVGAMSGQPYGKPYLEGLLFDPALVLHSRPTIAAVLAAEALAGAGLTMLKSIQHAHYEHGRHVIEHEVLTDLARHCALDAADFAAAFEAAPVDAHVAATRELMARLGATGFPAFALETGRHWCAVPHHAFASEPGAFRDWLVEEIQAAARHAG